MKKIANCKSSGNIVHGYIYKYVDIYGDTTYGYMPRGCVICFSSTDLTEVEEYINNDDFLSTFGVKPYYLKSFKH